jgi:cellulose synthase/poly-beta-1,6-N-acetylglucosamine synthase-like glycosyltransferase
VRDTVNIIVVGYHLGKIERECLGHVISNTTYPYVLTYYDNYKNKFTLTKLWNLLIEKSVTEYICLLNNDTRVAPNWLSNMMDTMKHIPVCGFVGPSTNCCHSPQSTVITYEDAQEFAGEEIEMKDPISGFCLLMRRCVWVEMKGFDSNYKHYGQESDLIDRAKARGWKSYWRKDAFVYHIGEASVKASGMDVDAARDEARKLYWSKRKP